MCYAILDILYVVYEVTIKLLFYYGNRKDNNMKLKRTVAIILVGVMISCFLCSCNKQILDTTYRYNRAIIYLQDGTVVDGKVESWKDFEDGDQIQVKIDGVTYLVHSSNITLIYDYSLNK